MDIDKIAALVNTEWELFQRTRNEGGRADYQDDYQTFCVNRGAQAMCWNEEIVERWLSDLTTALEEGRNLVTEKYARTMDLTSPEEYAALADSLPEVESSSNELAHIGAAVEAVCPKRAPECKPLPGGPGNHAEDGWLRLPGGR